MTTGVDLVNAFEWLINTYHPSYGFINRCHPDQPPHEGDCSGTTTFCLNHGGLPHACDGSFAQSRATHQHGERLSFSEALWTPGAFWWRGANEGQGALDGSKDGVWHGHVGISKGDGRTSLEARGHIPGVGEFSAFSLRWDFCGVFPGIVTAAHPTPTPMPTPTGGAVKATDPTDALMIPDGSGRLVLTADGTVRAYGRAQSFGQPKGKIDLAHAWATSIMWTPDRGGYWILSTDGGIYSYGNAGFVATFAHDVSPSLPAVQLVPFNTSYRAIRADGAIMSPR